MKNSQNKIALNCYRNALRNSKTPIGQSIAFLRNTFGNDIDNNEITLFINFLLMYLTNEQLVLLSTSKLLIAVRKGSNIIIIYIKINKI